MSTDSKMTREIVLETLGDPNPCSREHAREVYAAVEATYYEVERLREGQEALRAQTMRIRRALGDVPDGMDTEEAAKRLRGELAEAKREVAGKQARIDELMWEYEPARMTPEQIEEWGRHQVRCSPEEEKAIDAAIERERQ